MTLYEYLVTWLADAWPIKQIINFFLKQQIKREFKKIRAIHFKRDGDIIFGGDFARVDDDFSRAETTNSIATWNGNTWKALGDAPIVKGHN